MLSLKRNDLLAGLFLVMFSLCLSLYIMEGRHVDLSIPFVYTSDGIWISAVIKGLIDGSWYLSNGDIGFPFGSNLYDFPMSDSGNFLILKILGVISGDYAHALNLYFLFGFPVTALVSYFVIRNFSVSRTLSLTGAIIFTFIPFHFLRLGHLFYTWYFVVPLFAWYSLRISASEPLFFNITETRRSRILSVLILLGLSSFGVYYAFFGVLTMLAAGGVASLQFKSKKNIYSALLATLIVTVGVGANVAPNYLYQMKHGSNPEVAKRAPAHSETLGLKITQLLLPRPGHRSPKLAEITNKYSGHFPLVNENSFASLGMIGSIGFLLLLGVLLLQKKQTPENRKIFVLHIFARITLVLLLIATIGGFSSLFSMLITPEMRAWNRISIFIGFTSIAAFVLIADNLLDKIRNHRHIFSIKLSIVAALLSIAIWDQTTPACGECRISTQMEFKNDHDFVAKIEAIVPKGSAIYQLPYFPFPETPPIYHLADYSHFRGYLHSADLKWSYGAMKGRDGDLFFRALSQQSLTKQIETIQRLNFSGIYVDRRGYEDQGKAIEAELASLLSGVQAIVSEDHQLVFFSIPAKDGNNISSAGSNPLQIIERSGFEVDVERCLPPDCLKLSVAENASFPRQVGQIKGNKIITDGKPGLLAFGPQVTMSAGKYSLQIFGVAANIEGAIMDIVSEGGKNTLATFDHIPPSNKSTIILEREIRLNKQAKQLEVRIFADEYTVLSISGYKLKRMGD